LQEHAIAIACEFRFKTVGGVIKAGVNDAAVTAACVEAAFRLLFDERDAGVVETPFQFSRDAQPNDPAADYEKICFCYSCHTIQDLSARSASAAS
jgi:hypothetical protein